MKSGPAIAHRLRATAHGRPAAAGVIWLALWLGLAVPGQAQPSPAIIAHRGASGYLPEHTLEAKALAHAQGADYLEQDLVLSRDGELIVLHDLYLDGVTDVAERFPGRQRDDGRFYALDFSLAELRQLRVGERIQLDDGTELPADFSP